MPLRRVTKRGIISNRGQLARSSEESLVRYVSPPWSEGSRCSFSDWPEFEKVLEQKGTRELRREVQPLGSIVDTSVTVSRGRFCGRCTGLKARSYFDFCENCAGSSQVEELASQSTESLGVKNNGALWPPWFFLI